MSRSLTYLAALGDVNDARTWSGIPYHFLQAARAGGCIDEGLALVCDGPSWTRRRWLWNLGRTLSGQGRGGYQYSTSFLERLWQPVLPRLNDNAVINCFQLYPPTVVSNERIRKFYYIDMTLLQLFDFYQLRHTLGDSIVREALDREKEGYAAAERVVCHSRWAAQSVIDDYGVEPDKVFSIIPGANIDRAAWQEWHQSAQKPIRQPGQVLRLVFIGKYWDRKGLDRLLQAIQIVQRQSRRVELSVIGCSRTDLPVELRDVSDVHWLGFIDKRSDTERFLNVVTSADVGCLLSRAEAGGMVLREYHALGLIVLGTSVGGSPEHMLQETGHALAPDAPPEEIANWLMGLIDHPDIVQQLKDRAWELRRQATWDETVSRWRASMQ